MSLVYWKNYPFRKFVVEDDKILMKAVNTNKLETEEFEIVNFNKVNLLVHCKNIIVGYEIIFNHYFDLKIVKDNYVLLGDYSLRPRNPKLVYEDKFIKFVYFKQRNFLIIRKI